MRRTALVIGVVALFAAGGIGAATAASASPTNDPTADPTVAHGYYLALNGTGADGSWSPQSDTLVDPLVGQCYDLGSLATGPSAEWTESVNRTDKVALLSERTCAERAASAEGATGRAAAELDRVARWTSPDSVSDGTSDFAFRSVTFSDVP
jgi:hypothetical protein